VPAGRPYPAETRKQVVAEILTGDSIRSVAKRYGIPYTTVEGWWKEDRPIGVANTRTRERIVDEIYDTAFDILEGVRASARLLADESWARQYEPASLAVLVSALPDRGVRMLAGLQPSANAPGRPAIEGAVVAPDVEPAATGDDE